MHLVPARIHLPRGLVVAAVAAVALHALGTLILSGAGWVGRGELSHPTSPSDGSASSSVAKTASISGLRVRLTSQEPSIHPVVREPQGGPASSDLLQEALSSDDAQNLLSQDPSAEGGSAIFASTYLPAEEVDQGPAPEPGWILDEGALSEVGRAKMRLRLWVSESGRIDHVAVIQADPPGDWVGHAIQPLANTRMRPAKRDGRAVAATIVVELSADLETLR